MISIENIERVYQIIDREISLLEMRKNMNLKLKGQLIDNWLFIRDTFRRVCLDCAIAEGIVDKNVK